MTWTSPRRILPALGLLTLTACSGNMASGDREHVEAMAREHAHDAPVASAATTPAPAQEVVARDVTYATVEGQPVKGYLARPAGSSAALPGVVMIHEWWGLNDNIRTMARRLAGEGYAVLAVDLYRGRSAESPEQARELTTSVMQNPAPAEENLRAAAEYLAGEERAGRIGIVGWCFGGGWSLRGALAAPQRIDAAVMYYGQPITEPDQLSRLDAPLLGLFGAEDRGIPVERVREMEAALRKLGKDVTIEVYPGAAHAFANPSGTAYNAAAAEDAWARTLAFFARHLKGAAG
jgi:carboxymethylenebutenolidase